jgi:hypothetical protein
MLLFLEVCLVKKVIDTVNESEDVINFTKKQQSIYQLIKLGLIVLFTAHFCGCIFYFIGFNSEKIYGKNNWISQNMP